MKKTALALALSTLALGAANAHETSHWKNSAGEFVKNSSGECVQTINHNDADDAQCHGGAMVKRQIPTAVTDDGMAAKKKSMEEEARKRAEAAKAKAESEKAAMQTKQEEKKQALASMKSISLASGASFDTGSSTLSSAGKSELDGLAVKLKLLGNGLKGITIDGHTDSRGSEALNQSISEKRAKAVKSYLESKGVDGSKIKAMGHGETSPVATNDTAAGRGQNRRVEIKVDGDLVEAVK